MRAVRLAAARALEVIDLPEPAPREGEVTVAVAACGICGSDLSCYKTGVFAGAVLGHEISGVVERSEADGWTAGDHVAIDPKMPCGACEQCLTGASHRCGAALTQGIGQALHGGFAERLVAPASALHRLPASVNLETGSLAEPLAVVLHGLRLADARAEPVVVIGLGPIGLLTVAAMRARGASPIVGVDPVETRRELARALGADEVVAPGDPAVHGADAPLVVEASGHPSAVADAGNGAAPGGRVLLLGIPMSEATVSPMAWVVRELRIIGSIAQAAEDFDAAIALLARDPSLGQIITARVGLAEVPAAFERLIGAPDAGKISVVPG